jgi:hypothetical protein
MWLHGACLPVTHTSGAARISGHSLGSDRRDHRGHLMSDGVRGCADMDPNAGPIRRLERLFPWSCSLPTTTWRYLICHNPSPHPLAMKAAVVMVHWRPFEPVDFSPFPPFHGAKSAKVATQNVYGHNVFTVRSVDDRCAAGWLSATRLVGNDCPAFEGQIARLDPSWTGYPAPNRPSRSLRSVVA